MKEPGEMRMGKGKEGNMKGDWRTVEIAGKRRRIQILV